MSAGQATRQVKLLVLSRCSCRECGCHVGSCALCGKLTATCHGYALAGAGARASRCPGVQPGAAGNPIEEVASMLNRSNPRLLAPMRRTRVHLGLVFLPTSPAPCSLCC